MGDLEYRNASGILSGHLEAPIFARTGYQSGIELAPPRRTSRREEDLERDRTADLEDRTANLEDHTANLEETMADHGHSRHCWIGHLYQKVL